MFPPLYPAFKYEKGQDEGIVEVEGGKVTALQLL